MVTEIATWIAGWGIWGLTAGTKAFVAFTYVVSTLLYTVITAAMYGLSYITRKKPEEITSLDYLLVNGQSPKDPVPVVYGTMRIGGTWWWIETTGMLNTTLKACQTICEGEIDSLVQVKLNDVDISAKGGYAGYAFYNGAADQAVGPSGDAARNTAYLYVYFVFSHWISMWSKIPLVTATVKGLKCYDPRTETTEWSNNPAVCIYDFMRNTRYGMGIDASFIDTTSIIDVANTLDDEGYEMNAVVAAKAPALDILTELLTSCRCSMLYSQGLWKMKFLEYEAPVMSLDEDDIVKESFTFNFPAAADLPNTIIVKFANADNDYVQEEFKIHDESQIINVDKEERAQTITLTGTTSYEQAHKCGVYQLERLKLGCRFIFVAGPKAIPLEPGDVIQVTHSLPGWTNQLVRIEEARYLPSGEVQLSVLLEHEDLYDDIVNIVDHTEWSTTLIDPTEILPQPDNVQFTEENYIMKDNTFTRLKGTWSFTHSFIDYVEVWISRDLTNWYMHTKTSGDFTIEPVYEGETYYIKLRAVSIYGSRADLNDLDYYARTISGVADPPNNVTGFNIGVADDKLSMGWNAVTNTDLLYYEIRWGASWGTAIPIAQVKATKKTFTGVKPGTHTFLIKAKDTLNNYSLVAGQKTVTIQNPIGYAQETAYGTDFSDSTSYWNVEWYDDPVHGRVLSVCDSTASLTGWWESPIYDLGSNDFRKLWNIFSWASDTPGGTWLAGAGDFDWEDVFDIGETWLQQFAGAPVGTIEMTLYFSEDGIDWDSFTGFELVSHECKGRYFYYRVTLTNVSDEVEILLKPVTFYSWMRT